MNELLERFPETRICMPVLPDTEPVFRHTLDVDQKNIEPLPALRSKIKAQKHFWRDVSACALRSRRDEETLICPASEITKKE